MTLKLEDGKTYIKRNGQITTVKYTPPSGVSSAYCFTGDEGDAQITYTEDGLWFVGQVRDEDIIEEAPQDKATGEYSKLMKAVITDKPFTIEAGKSYFNRLGNLVKVIDNPCQKNSKYPFSDKDDSPFTYTKSGAWGHEQEHDWDLVVEATAPAGEQLAPDTSGTDKPFTIEAGRSYFNRLGEIVEVIDNPIKKNSKYPFSDRGDDPLTYTKSGAWRASGGGESNWDLVASAAVPAGEQLIPDETLFSYTAHSYVSCGTTTALPVLVIGKVPPINKPCASTLARPSSAIY